MKIKLALFSLIYLVATEALALGAVSRACQFTKIPSPLRYTAGQFFASIGGDPYVAELSNKSEFEQANYWIMESLTVDWLRARYYLYAQSAHYYRNPHPDANTYQMWMLYTSFYSKVWTAETVSDALIADPRFSPWYANRGKLFSGRAGNDKIIENLGTYHTQRASYGTHYYYDPVSKVTARLPDTTAYDCNLGEWGFGKGIFDR